MVIPQAAASMFSQLQPPQHLQGGGGGGGGGGGLTQSVCASSQLLDGENAGNGHGQPPPQWSSTFFQIRPPPLA